MNQMNISLSVAYKTDRDQLFLSKTHDKQENPGL